MGGGRAPELISSLVQALISKVEQLRCFYQEGHTRGGLEVSAAEGVLPASPLNRMALGLWFQGEGVNKIDHGKSHSRRKTRRSLLSRKNL